MNILYSPSNIPLPHLAPHSCSLTLDLSRYVESLEKKRERAPKG